MRCTVGLAETVVEPTPLATPLEHAVVARSFTTLQTQGTGITDDRATSNLQNPQNRQAWASFEGFEGGERFQACLPLSPSRGGRAVTTSFGHSVRGKVVDRRYVSS